MEGRRPLVHGDGQQSRDFTFVADAVQANIKAATAPGVSGRIYNIACGRQTTLLELLAEINRALGTNVAPEQGPGRPGDVRHSLADIARAQADLGYRPTTDVAKGVRAYVEWYRAQDKSARPLALSA